MCGVHAGARRAYQSSRTTSRSATAPPLQSVMIGSLPIQLVATAGADHTIRLWCTSTGCQLQALRAHQDRVTRLRWSPCGSLLASASLEGGTRLWHLHPSVLAASPCSTGTQLLAPEAVLQGDEAEGRTSCLAFSPDSSLLATGSSTGTVRLWATTGGEGGSHQKLGGHGSLVSSVCFSPCGTLLASASGGCTGCTVLPAAATGHSKLWNKRRSCRGLAGTWLRV